MTLVQAILTATISLAKRSGCPVTAYATAALTDVDAVPVRSPVTLPVTLPINPPLKAVATTTSGKRSGESKPEVKLVAS